MSRNPLNDEQISAVLLWHDPMVVAFPPGHRLAGSRQISLAELHDEDIVFLRFDAGPVFCPLEMAAA